MQVSPASFVLPVETFPVENFTIYEDFLGGGPALAKCGYPDPEAGDPGYCYGAASSLADPDLALAPHSRTLYDYELPLVLEPMVVMIRIRASNEGLQRFHHNGQGLVGAFSVIVKISLMFI